MTRSLWLLAITAFLGLGWFAHGAIENTDSLVTLNSARAWVLRGDPGLVRAVDVADQIPDEPNWLAEQAAAELMYASEISGEPRLGRIGVNGRQYAWFPIGHQVLMLPCVVLGEILTDWFPEPERRLAAEGVPVFRVFFWHQFAASLMGLLFACGSVLLWFLIAVRMGLISRDALLVTAALTLCTQFLGSSVESMSDVPGAFFLYACVLAIIHYIQGARPQIALTSAGFLAGWAVLVRYPHVVPVAVFCCWAVQHAWRERRVIRDLVWLVVGGLPCLAFLLWMNYQRFGDVFETGYSTALGWGSYPMGRGVVMVLASPAKGILIFSPLLLLAIAQFRRRSVWSWSVACSTAALALPVLSFANLCLWTAGQSWANRYLMPMVLLFLLFVLARTTPWRRHGPWFFGLCLLGFVINLAGLMSPYRGFLELSHHVAREQGRPPAAVMESWDLTPVVGHWRYAALNLQGGLEPGSDVNPCDEIFGADVEPLYPASPEDRGFGHWWAVYLHRYGVGLPPAWMGPVWLLALGFALRALLKSLRH